MTDALVTAIGIDPSEVTGVDDVVEMPALTSETRLEFGAVETGHVGDLPQTGRVMVKDEDLCVHCGLCAERCPTGAWDMQKSTLLIPYALDEAVADEKQPAVGGATK